MRLKAQIVRRKSTFDNPMLPVSISANPYERLISQIMRIESQPQLRLEDERRGYERYQAVLSDFDSKLSALHSQLETLTDVISNPFEARAATVEEDAGFGVTAGDAAAFGSHTIEVERLAVADTRVSKQYDSAGTALRGFFDTYGAQTFSISVAAPTDSNPDHRESISVTVDPTGSSDEAILKEIGAAIDQAMADAVDAGTITKEQAAQASMINETTDTARLSVRSGQTGYANRLGFTDSADGLLAQLEVNANTVVTGTGGGQITEVGTDETSKLNSKFILDGLTLYRSSNQVTDALDGLTIDLNEAGGPAAEFSVDPDAEGIKEEVNAFIDKYNAVLDYIAKKSEVDGESGTRGDFAGDRTFTSLRYKMRSDVIRMVEGQPEDAPDALAEIGIEINDDGTLTLADEDELLAAVEEDAGAVQSLFAGDDGVATRLKERLDQYIDFGGLIDIREDSIEARLDRIDDRIADWDDRLARREEQLRMKFAQVQKTISLFQGQQRFLSGFFGGRF